MIRPKNKTVRLEEVVIDQRAQTRADGLDEAHVAQMVDDLKDLPPMLVVDVNGRLMLADGFHRHAAYRRAKMLRVPVAVIAGTEDDWIDAFASANDGQKGKPRTREDKRNSVRRCLELRPGWSNRRVAESAKVSEGLVREVRKYAPEPTTENEKQTDGQVRKYAPETTDGNTSQLRDHAPDEPAKVEGKDGKHYPASNQKPKKTSEAAPTPKTEDEPAAAVIVTDSAPLVPDQSPSPEPVIPQAEQPDEDTEQSPTTVDEDPSDVFCETLNTICRELDTIGQRVAALKESPYGRFVHWQSAQVQIKNGRETLWQGRPTHQCPYCRKAGELQPNCRCCGGLNVCTKQSYKAGVAAVGGVEE